MKIGVYFSIFLQLLQCHVIYVYMYFSLFHLFASLLKILLDVTSYFIYIYIKYVLKFSYIFVFFNIFYIFCFHLSIICVSDYLCDWISVHDCILINVWYVSVLAYCPTYYGRCLMRGRGYLLDAQNLIPSSHGL